MKRVNQYQFYLMGTIVHPLSTIKEGQSVLETAWSLHSARSWIAWLLSDQLVELTVAREAAQNLQSAISSVIPENTDDFATIDKSKTLAWIDMYRITTTLSEFETVFSAELPTIATYTVSKKGIYSTADLVERSENAIDWEARKVINDAAINDFKQAGRCLAFELATAAGFHTMRSVEDVLRKYWRLGMAKPDTEKAPEMSQCINELRAAKENPKLMDILDHIRDLHRNTLMHPEAFLTSTEAFRLFDVAKSAISAMADRIAELQNELQKKATAAKNTANAPAVAAPAAI